MNISNELNKIIKEQENELANLMYAYMSFQFGEQVSVSDDYRNNLTNNSVAKVSKNNTKHLRSNTGALLNSFFTTQNFTLNYVNGVFAGGIKSDLPYARIHEYGDFVKSKTQFSMFGGLMKMFFKTGDEAYKIMAFSALKKGGVTIPARPYFNPFINEMNKDGLPKWWNEVEKRLQIFINEVTINV